MNAGGMRNRVQLQSKTVTRDTFGAETITWTEEAVLWAKVEPITAREYFSSMQMQSQVTHKITIRYYAGLRTDWRVKWGSRLFDIQSALNLEERNREMTLLCTEWVT